LRAENGRIGGVNLLWNQIAQRAGIALTDQQHELLNQYLDLLLDANKRMNLTRITDRAAAEVQHVADALTLLPYLPAGPLRIADVGSGGGVPGIPLAIVRSDCSFVLIESTRKKASYLRDAVRQLKLPNVLVNDSRAEEVARTDQRESYDVVTARAVGALVWLAEWCLPLTKKGGKVLAMKGAKIAEELPEANKAIRLLGGAEPAVHPVDLPAAEHHVLVEILKMSRTDAKYPRNPTATGGNPLK
jgi:16S rRNA (guanine527-N7)-methyltransferase